jgi:dihydrofolate synthase/folylpolyglutamate synthase
MTYQATLDYMMAQLPMFHRIGAAAFKKDLSNTLALCAHLDNPHQKFKSIHVGGTNGKGSTSHLLAAVLQAAGYKVGLYTSPHYKDFRERIKINGTYISKHYVVDFIEKNKTVLEEIQPSFFEMTVALAFDYFADNQVDIAVIEVGLGGRLDSTNVITPELSVITNISFDHVAMLGDTIELIAFEKAGIIKKNVPVVIGETQIGSDTVFLAKAKEVQTEITFADQIFDVKKIENLSGFSKPNKFNAPNQNAFYTIEKNNALFLEKIETQLFGDYQLKNLATVFQTIEQLRALNYRISDEHIRFALLNVQDMVKFMGRWQRLSEMPLVIADSGHNEAGVISAVEQLKTLTFNNLYIVTGFVNDKDVSKILSLYPKNATYFFAKANIPRGLDAVILKEKAIEFDLQGKAYSSVKNAFIAAKKRAKNDDLVLVLGSIFVVAEVL